MQDIRECWQPFVDSHVCVIHLFVHESPGAFLAPKRIRTFRFGASDSFRWRRRYRRCRFIYFDRIIIFRVVIFNRIHISIVFEIRTKLVHFQILDRIFAWNEICNQLSICIHWIVAITHFRCHHSQHRLRCVPMCQSREMHLSQLFRVPSTSAATVHRSVQFLAI